MKIALLSFHNAINFGAALQAYALQEALSLKNIDCEYINYQNETRRNMYNMTYHIKSNLKKGKIIEASKYLLGTPFMRLRKYRFDKFYSSYLKSTKKIYRSSTDAEELNDLYDKFIVGSDQVWNCENNGNDFSFLLEFVKDYNKKISYSSSFGMASIPEELKERYKENLLNIKHLAVREQIGVDLVKELTGRDAELVLDPVFLLTKDQWLKLGNKRSKTKGRYIFSYTNKKNQLEAFLNQTNYNLKNTCVHKVARHLTISDFISSSIKQRYTMSPVDFVDTVNNAELVVSASFHCLAMAIIMNKQFVAILTGDKGKDERVMNLMKLTGLEDRIFTEGMNLNQVHRLIDYNRLNEIVEKYRIKSLTYLENALNN